LPQAQEGGFVNDPSLSIFTLAQLVGQPEAASEEVSAAPWLGGLPRARMPALGLAIGTDGACPTCSRQHRVLALGSVHDLESNKPAARSTERGVAV